MKKLILLLILILSGLMIVEAQIPQAMKYKAIAKDDWGVALPNKDISLRFTIIQGSEYGNPIYTETHHTTTNKFGLMDVNIGEGNAVYGSFSDIDWGVDKYFLQIEMDTKGGSDFKLETGAQQLLSVPYALFSESSGNVFSGDYQHLYNVPTSLSHFANDVGYITDFTETDPTVPGAISTHSGYPDVHHARYSDAEALSAVSLAGYLKTELDPLFEAHVSSGILASDIANWNTAYGWGDHTLANYLTDYTESDPIWTSAMVNYYTVPQLQTAGSSEVNWSNLSNVPVGFADNEDNTIDDDPDPINEIQVLSLADNILNLSLNGTPTPIDLSPYL